MPSANTHSYPDATERRRRARIQSATQGWLIPERDALAADAEPWEVRVNDISREGVGFESTEKVDAGALYRIRIGRGPMRLARRIRVVDCRPGPDGHYRIGGEFVALAGTSAGSSASPGDRVGAAQKQSGRPRGQHKAAGPQSPAPM